MGHEHRKQSTQPQRKKPRRGAVTLPHIRGVTERVQRAAQKHRVSTPVEPHVKLRQLLVHPKDKIDQNNECDEIPCCSCNKTYIGETGRPFYTRKKEDPRERDKEPDKRHLGKDIGTQSKATVRNAGLWKRWK